MTSIDRFEPTGDPSFDDIDEQERKDNAKADDGDDL